jgi:hypothetical protein
VQEDIGGLDISVRDTHLLQVPESVVEIQNNSFDFGLREGLLLEPLVEIPFVAELSDDVAVALGEESLLEVKDVGVVQGLQYLDLLVDQFLQSFGLEFVQGDDFDGYCVLCVGKGVRVRMFCPR